MVSSSREVVKEFVFNVEGLGESVKARITRDLEPISEIGEYSWDISHLWNTAGGIYSPSTRHGKTYEEVEALMMAYAKSFTIEHGYSKNEFY
ncbi:hypothetical protein O5O45_00140 [Hahella aquimaris]|uniref:hypothetical protein n=1 Tax=Hahella sp. HNIBRBA332 TaxID=3015983 RepID=UPI00273A9481|nr:hypothetical protein [Hahella sp. HNIBRBA332]WLQ14349.1 hypothetical protein O5O45_00140 [Hahella sp. HNIBRBA332]